MTFTRRTGALAALALTLVLGACSTPADVAVPGLEPQFGTDGNDYGSDVTLTSSGSIIALSSETGSAYVETEYANGYADYEKIHWDRYDKNGNFVSQTVLDSTDCLYEDVEFYGTKDYCETTLTPKTIVADAKGFTYALALYNKYAWEYDVDQDLNEFRYYIYKVDASGNLVRRTTLADDTGDGSGTSVDIAVDANGNTYVAASLRNAYGEVKNFTAKYSTTGGLIWQRTSPVGTLYGVTVSSNGSVYVGGSGGVVKYSNAGGQSWKISGDTRDVAAVGTNTVYARNLTTVRKLDATGKQLWSKAQTGLSGLVIGDMTTDSSANVYITGKYGPSTNRDVFVRKLSASSGTAAYSKVFATSAYDDGRGIATLTGSEVYVTGETQGSLAHANYGGKDGYLRKMDANGNRVWTR